MGNNTKLISVEKHRAKFEAPNKLIKVRKVWLPASITLSSEVYNMQRYSPYFQESRHLHALKRARGSSGRFLIPRSFKNQTLNRISSRTLRECLALFGGRMLILGLTFFLSFCFTKKKETYYFCSHGLVINGIYNKLFFFVF